MTETATRSPSIAAPLTSHAPIPGEQRRTAFGLPDALLLLMAVIWGVNFVVVKYATTVFNPVAFTGLRVSTVAAFLWLLAFVRGRAPLTRRDVVALFLLGMLGNGLYQLFF